MSFLCPVVLLAIGLSLGGGLFYASTRMRSRLKTIEDAKPCKAGEPVAGLVKLQGKIQAVDPHRLLTSPIDQKKCVYYRLVIEEHRQALITSGKTKSMGSWVPIVEDEQSIPMVIADETGALTINPKEAQLDFESSRTHANLFTSLPKEMMERLQARYKIVASTSFVPKQMRYTEVAIMQDQEVFAVGECEIEDGQATLTSKEHPLMLTFRNEQQVLRNGKITLTIFKALAVGVPALFLAFAVFAFMSVWSDSSKEHVAKDANQETIAQLKSPSYSERAKAAQKLAGIPAVKSEVPAVAPELNVLLESANSFQRESAIDAINNGWGSSVNEPALRRLRENTTDARVQREIDAALKKIAK
jgi:hypothetical protein